MSPPKNNSDDFWQCYGCDQTFSRRTDEEQWIAQRHYHYCVLVKDADYMKRLKERTSLGPRDLFTRRFTANRMSSERNTLIPSGDNQKALA